MPRPRQRDGLARRGSILATVEEEPGIHMTVLAARSGLSWHATAYHVRILERLGLVESGRGGRDRRVFPAGLSASHRAALVAARTERALDVLRILLDVAPQGVATISRRMGCSPKVVRRAMAALQAAQLVQQSGSWRPTYLPDRAAARRFLGQAVADAAPTIRRPDRREIAGAASS